jgi:acetylornithine deacetylase/succinyl-diaminopimelate desuccinylase-like protein
VSLRDEATVLLQGLLRLNTVSPPGNETIAAELLRDYLAASDIPCELVGRTPDRLNLVARLKGGDGPTLALLAHTDTVRADPEEWSRDPWSGDLVDGEIWGRGALDMKDQVAASAVAFASLWREGVKPAGDVILALTADEEVNEGFGLSWLVEEHPELVRADYALNEGGGERCVFGTDVFYLCATGEKMSAPFRIRVQGRSGHASVPSIADNALVKAGPIIEALDRYRPPQALIPEVARFLELVLGEHPPLDEALDRARLLHPLAEHDDGRGVEADQRDSGGVRGHRGLPSAAGHDPRSRRSTRAGRDRPGGLRPRVARERRGNPLSSRDAALVGARSVGR